MNIEDKILRYFENNKKDEAFKMILEYYQLPIFKSVLFLLKNKQDAEDVCQNAFIKAYKNFNSFRGHSSIFTWLYRIAKNESLNALKKINTQRNIRIITNELKNEAEFGFSYTADEIENRLMEALNQLPERQKQVFVMRYFEELSYKQISEILGVSIGGLKANFHHAAKKIETLIINKLTF